MNFSHKDLHYINGTKFSNGYSLEFKNQPNKIFKRIELVEELVRDKKVLHLGCADHLPLINQKISSNNWLHKRITDSASYCVGIDINKEAIRHCHSLGYNNILNCDIYKDSIPDELSSHYFDYVVIGELLEHVDNPVSFLKQVSAFLENRFSEIVVTGPNALRWNNTKNSFQQKEVINSDHRFWFTPYTLAKLIVLADLTPLNFWFCMTGGINRRNYFYSWFLKRYPAFQDTIIISAKI